MNPFPSITPERLLNLIRLIEPTGHTPPGCRAILVLNECGEWQARVEIESMDFCTWNLVVEGSLASSPSSAGASLEAALLNEEARLHTIAQRPAPSAQRPAPVHALLPGAPEMTIYSPAHPDRAIREEWIGWSLFRRADDGQTGCCVGLSTNQSQAQLWLDGAPLDSIEHYTSPRDTSFDDD